jgi:hypothetical protein
MRGPGNSRTDMMFAKRGNSMWSNQGESSMKRAEKVSLVMGIIIGLMGGSSRTQGTSSRTDRRDIMERRGGNPNMVGWRRSRISEQHSGRDCLST